MTHVDALDEFRETGHSGFKQNAPESAGDQILLVVAQHDPATPREKVSEDVVFVRLKGHSLRGSSLMISLIRWASSSGLNFAMKSSAPTLATMALLNTPLSEVCSMMNRFCSCGLPLHNVVKV